MPLLIVALGVIVLLILIMKFNLNTFISLLIVSFLVALGLGIPLTKIISVIEKGIGEQLGDLILIFGLGAILGKLVADAGGAHRIAISLAKKFGKKRIQLAIIAASFIIGIALFFEVGLVLLLPIIFEIGVALGISLLYVGTPMIAALMATHGFLPPHPAPTALVQSYHANTAYVLLVGLCIAVPAVLIGGTLLNRLLFHLLPQVYTHSGNEELLDKKRHFDDNQVPSLSLSIFTCLLPVLLMISATLITDLITFSKVIEQIIQLIGSPPGAMMTSVLFALYAMGIRQKRSMEDIEKTITKAIRQISMLLLIIGAGGALKEVMITGGVGDYVANLFKGSPLSPLVLAWVITVLIRVCIGSSTVAALTAAGVVAPLVSATGVSPTLIVLATGAGSVFGGHVNDPGFWLFKEYFDLNIKDTLKTYTVMGSMLSLIGILLICVFSVFM
ncbi:gluconate:H+ symporter [Sporolactobacillus shoreicorticis]|uniref:Gluconate:H+ symporter n=1 Tax=Sporolactobacillus shoreicorticis TaxID=1923877 RepID=A0ABW5S800_9BACL|nr:gluconate:H+ symporter [Sporolactobacillus shoreicorticis]MCO7128134.1 gluconate:H+ symporter [Sporolactobacillus shoreicorticis]